MNKNVKLSAVAAAMTLALAACGGSSNTTTEPTTTEPTTFDFAATAMIENLNDNVIVEGYNGLNVKAEALYEATVALEANPSDATLKVAQQAWIDARQPWEQGESHIFGPVDQLSIDPHLDSWPLATTDLNNVLDSVSDINETLIKNMNDNVQGYHTMEYLLFGDGMDDNEKSVAEFKDAEYDYLMATASIFKGYTADLAGAWTDGVADDDGALGTPYQESVKTANNDIYGSQLAVVEELVNGMIGIIDEVGNGKIADPFGGSLAQADTSLVESQYSWNSLTDFANNITGVLNVYQGDLGENTDAQGIYDFVAAGDAVLAERIMAEIKQSITDINAIAGDSDMPFRQVISDEAGRVRIQTAIDSLAVLQASLETDVIALVKTWSGE